MALGNNGLYTGLIYLIIGPSVLLALKLISDSKFFKKGITIKCTDGNAQYAPLSLPSNVSKNAEYPLNSAQNNKKAAGAADIEARITGRPYLAIANSILYEDAVLTGRYRLPAENSDVLKANGMINLGDISRKSVLEGSYLGVVTLNYLQKRRANALPERFSKYNSLLLLALALKKLRVVEFDSVNWVIT